MKSGIISAPGMDVLATTAGIPPQSTQRAADGSTPFAKMRTRVPRADTKGEGRAQRYKRFEVFKVAERRGPTAHRPMPMTRAARLRMRVVHAQACAGVRR